MNLVHDTEIVSVSREIIGILTFLVSCSHGKDTSLELIPPMEDENQILFEIRFVYVKSKLGIF